MLPRQVFGTNDLLVEEKSTSRSELPCPACIVFVRYGWLICVTLPFSKAVAKPKVGLELPGRLTLNLVPPSELHHPKHVSELALPTGNLFQDV